MFLRLCQVSALLSTVFLAALPANSSTITSSNNDIIGFASGSNFSGLEWSGSEPTWINSVTSDASASGWTPSSSITSVSTSPGGVTFGVSGANGTGSNSIQGFSTTPMVITPTGGGGGLTAIVFELTTTGSITVQLTLSDGSTVSETSSTGTGGWVSFLSPLQITAIKLNGDGNSFSIQDIDTGTAIVADLPPQGGDPSAPEGASLWLTGGGLLVLSRFLRRRCGGA
jgi:hypothetical protein